MLNSKILHTSQYLIILLAFILPLSKASVATSTLIFLAMLLITQRADYQKFMLTIWNNIVFRYLLIFIFLNIFSLFFVEMKHFQEAINYVKRYFYIIVISVAIYTFLKEENIDKVLSAFLLGMLTSELLSYGIFLEIITIKNVSALDPTPFMNHIDYSVFLAFTSLVLLNKVLNEPKFKYKIFYLLFFTSTTTNLFITGGRIGQLAFFITLLVLFLINFKQKIKALLVFLLFSMAIFLLAYNLSITFKSRLHQGIKNINLVINKQKYCSSWGLRIGSIIIAKDIITRDPILGIGVENNIIELQRLVHTKYPSMKCIDWVKSYHNQYLDVLTQHGIVGFFIFIMVFISILKLKFLIQEYKNISIILTFVFLISFLGDALFFRYFISGFFGLFLGIILAKNKSYILTNKI